MGYLGYKPADKPLTSADITDSIITSAKIVDGTIANADINSSAAIAKTKLNLTGTIGISDLSATGTASSTTFLRGDNAWGEAGAAAGQVIQVLGATESTQRTTTSTSYVTASNTLSVTITPSSSSNKILIIANLNIYAEASTGAHFTIFRGSTNLGAAIGMVYINTEMYVSCGLSFLDSPATTSATTYQVYFKKSGSGSAYYNANSTTGSITCLEIKG